ncbi:MAG: dihydrolipoyl dehydrogenase [bacterium]
MEKYKVVVIGGGPGGYTAAIRAAQLGADVCLIEKGRVGGTCLNRGCIPTKSLLSSVELFAKVKKASEYGVSTGEVSADLKKMVIRKNEIVAKLVHGVEMLLKSNKIRLVKGRGSLLGGNQVEITPVDGEKETVTAENIIIATGSEPALIPAFGIDNKRVITSTEALNLTETPKSVIVVGGGVIGCEFSCIFSELGSEVTILELMPRILPLEDKTIALKLAASLKKRGVKIKTKVKITEIRKQAGQVAAVLEDGSEVAAEKALVSIGRALNTDGLGLDRAGVKQGARGQIEVDDYLRTNVSHIYAIGDVVGRVMLAHVAAAQGMVAAANIAGRNKVMDYAVIPSCIFTSPEIGTVGMTADKAKEAGYEVKLGNFSFMGLGKALAMGEAEGSVRLVVDAATDVVLGGQIIGPHATDLIAEVALAVRYKHTAAQVTDTIHAHPTLAEAVAEAAEDVHQLAIHAVARKKSSR